jgi:hypothetical protein
MLAFASMGSLLLLDRNAGDEADPTDYASDRFSRWEQIQQIPEGVVFRDSMNEILITEFQSQENTQLKVWHSPITPDILPKGWSAQKWRGGWLWGKKSDLEVWEENPGEMASHWHPRSDGFTRLEKTTNGDFKSQFKTRKASGFWTETTWLKSRAVSSSQPLASEWLAAWEKASKGGLGLVECHMARWETPVGASPDSALESFWNGNWSTWRWESGETLQIWGWADSTGFKSDGVGDIYSDGWYRWGSSDRPPSWNAFERLLHQSEPSSLNWDGLHWTSNASRLGKLQTEQRIAWVVKGEQTDPPVSKIKADEGVDSRLPQQTSTLALVKNHRLDKKMTVTWAPPFVMAGLDNENVWKIKLAGEKRPKAWEVDLYRNGKYQVALANEQSFHVVDILGREVKGYPIAPASGITASAVIDYDRNRKYRIFLASGDGDLLNFRQEGMPTPGWDFEPRSERTIVHVKHIRVGNRDYLYVGHEDGSIRLLKRSGADRFKSSVSVPSNQVPCFRLSQSISSSTVLYIDDSGWLQERTFGTNEPVGMSRMTRGISAAMDDRDGDGIQEVIVQTLAGEEVWNARNERINP